MNREQYEEDLKRRQAEHLRQVRGNRDRNWSPCAHNQCMQCHGTGIKLDGTYCIHSLYCSCPNCSPGCCYTPQTTPPRWESYTVAPQTWASQAAGPSCGYIPGAGNMCIDNGYVSFQAETEPGFVAAVELASQGIVAQMAGTYQSAKPLWGLG